MKIKQLIFFCFLFSSGFSQITNTRKWRYTERDSLDNALLFYEEKNYLLSLPILEKVIQNHPSENFIKYLYGICCLYRSDRHEASLKALSEVYLVNQGIDMIEYDLARAYHYNYKFDEALDLVNKHLSYRRIKPEDKANGEILKMHIYNAKNLMLAPNKAKISILSNIINTTEDEFLPLISVNESVLIFNYIGSKSIGGKLNAFLQPDKNGVYTSDIYISKKQNDKFVEPNAIENINTNSNDIAISLSQDGQILFTYKNISDGHGDIYASYLTGDTYSKPAKLKGKVNSYSWEGQCSLSPDGKTLYFSSERSGGYGGKDIYKAKLLADSIWGNVVNLGDSINTPYDEDSPFMHCDGATLFYSSNGIKSGGGYDVFKANMDLKDSAFRHIENIGYPINTPDDDLYFVLNANGSKGYYSAGRSGGEGLKDIYQVETGFDASKSKLLLLQGTISKSNELVDASIKVENMSNNNSLYKNFKSNKGSYIVTLPFGKEYRVTYSRPKFADQTLTLTTVGFSAYSEKIQNINFDPVSDIVKTVTTPSVHLAKITHTVQVSANTPTANVVQSKISPTVATTQPLVTKVSASPTVVSTPTISAIKSNTSVVTSTPTVIVKNVTATVATTPSVAVTKSISPAVSSTTVLIVKTVTPTVIAIPTVTTIKSTTPTIAAKITTQSVTATSTVVSNKLVPSTYYTTPTVNLNPVTSSTVPTIKAIEQTSITTLENFVPRTPAQEKVKLYADKYPDISADSLEFRVQIAAYKNPKTYDFPHLKKLGPIDNLLLIDGITRVMVGGKFFTLRKAYEHNKKVVIAGQNDAFVTVIYKGKRIVLEDLEAMGIFKLK